MGADRCPTCRRRYTRSSEVNRKYWALLHAMSERLTPRGQHFSPQTWHLWAKSKWLGCTDTTLPSGRTMSLPHSTAGLDAHEFANYFDHVQHFANEHGVWLEDSEEAA